MVENTFMCPSKQETKISICIGCGHEIYDQWILRVSPDLEWHQACLKCVDCHKFLDETSTCFVRDGKTYCRTDYCRLFGSKCSKCDKHFKKEDFVMRAREKIFHVDCFHCIACRRLLVPGEEFALYKDSKLYCKMDFDALEKSKSLNFSREPPPQATHLHQVSYSFAPNSPGSRTNSQLGLGPNSLTSLVAPLPPQAMAPCGLTPTELPSPLSTGGSGGSGSSYSKKEKKKDQKTTRVRTVLNEKQLHTLRTCYNANPRPDALMKEQLVEMTGLSPRVIRVWFQNKRCKDKKKQILMKTIQQQHEKHQTLNGLRLQGVGPLIAASPSRHDVPLMPPLDVHQYSQNPSLWGNGPGDYCGTLVNVSQAMKLEQPGSLMDSQTPPFQQLVHGFGDPNDPSMTYFSNGGPGNLTQLQTTHRGDSSGGGRDLDSMGNGDFVSISPSIAASDLSSPSCSD